MIAKRTFSALYAPGRCNNFKRDVQGFSVQGRRLKGMSIPFSRAFNGINAVQSKQAFKSPKRFNVHPSPGELYLHRHCPHPRTSYICRAQVPCRAILKKFVGSDTLSACRLRSSRDFHQAKKKKQSVSGNVAKKVWVGRQERNFIFF